MEESDISDAVAFLVSDQAKWITGATLNVGRGLCSRNDQHLTGDAMTSSAATKARH